LRMGFSRVVVLATAHRSIYAPSNGGLNTHLLVPDYQPPRTGVLVPYGRNDHVHGLRGNRFLDKHHFSLVASWATSVALGVANEHYASA
jgi:hypothetical protein